MDPITSKYPELTPYQFASNSPISGVDLDGLEYNNSSTYVHKVLPLLRKAAPQYIVPQQQATLSTDRYPNGTSQSNQLQADYQRNQAYNRATMDPLAGSMIYPMANAAGQYAERPLIMLSGLTRDTNKVIFGKGRKILDYLHLM